MALNLLSNPQFLIDSNADGLANSWASYALGTATVTKSLVAGYPFGNGQRIQVGGEATSGDSRILRQITPAYGCDAGDVVTLSAYFKGEFTGCSMQFNLLFNSVTGYAGGGVPSTLSTINATTFTRIAMTATAPANTAYPYFDLRCYNFDTGDSVDITVACAKLEIASAASDFLDVAHPVVRSM